MQKQDKESVKAIGLQLVLAVCDRKDLWSRYMV